MEFICIKILIKTNFLSMVQICLRKYSEIICCELQLYINFNNILRSFSKIENLFHHFVKSFGGIDRETCSPPPSKSVTKIMPFVDIRA